MSHPSTPMPTSSTTSGPSSETNNNDWRAPVTQASRNLEILEIAKVLASLEPGATSQSKLMLATRFEATIFAAATSMVDYRKKLSKRLKKLQKTYVPGTHPLASATEVEQQIILLRRQYGKALALIHKNGALAVAAMKEKSGSDRANHLQQHIDNALVWASQLGVLPNNDPKAIPKLSSDELKRLKLHLEQRVGNIRSHVVKLTQPDLFLQERLEEMDTRTMCPQASQLLATTMMERFQSYKWNEFQNPTKTLQHAMEKAFQLVPPPSRDPNSKMVAALAHLEALRATSQVVLACTVIPNPPTTTNPALPTRNSITPAETTVSTATRDTSVLPPQTQLLSKCHARAVNGIGFLKEEWPLIHPVETFKKSAVSLEDVWVKAMELPSVAGGDDVGDVGALSNDPMTVQTLSSDLSPLSKQRQQHNRHVHTRVIRSKVFLAPGRACPSNILPAFKRKGAQLVQSSSDSSHLILHFDDAFLMTIYLVPLVVQIHPKNQSIRNGSNSAPCSVWGVDGTWDTLGQVIQDRIDHAAAQATKVLRFLFAEASSVNGGVCVNVNGGGNNIPNKKVLRSDFEQEISEATALLKFLQIARTTYQPDWQDVED